MNSPRYAGAPPSLVVGGVCLLANFSTCWEVGKLAGQGGGGTAGARRGKRTRRARAVVGVAGWCWVVAGQEAVLQGVGGLAALRGGAGSRGEEAGAGVVVYPGVSRRARAVGGVDGMRGGERGDQVAGAGVRFGGLPPG